MSTKKTLLEEELSVICSAYNPLGVPYPVFYLLTQYNKICVLRVLVGITRPLRQASRNGKPGWESPNNFPINQGYLAVGKVHCSLIMAKSRLVPLKAMTIPRMELSAAVLATRLDRMIKQEVTMPINKSTFWTHGTCVLHYIENKDKRIQTFVANRISAILDQSTATQWRHLTLYRIPPPSIKGITVEALSNNEC